MIGDHLQDLDDLDIDEVKAWRLLAMEAMDCAWRNGGRRAVLCVLAGFAWVLAYVCVGTGEGRNLKNWFDTAFERYTTEAKSDMVKLGLRDIAEEGRHARQ